MEIPCSVYSLVSAMILMYIRWYLRTHCALRKKLCLFVKKNEATVDVNKCLKQIELPNLLHVCAFYSDLPPYIYSMVPTVDGRKKMFFHRIGSQKRFFCFQIMEIPDIYKSDNCWLKNKYWTLFLLNSPLLVKPYSLYLITSIILFVL